MEGSDAPDIDDVANALHNTLIGHDVNQAERELMAFSEHPSYATILVDIICDPTYESVQHSAAVTLKNFIKLKGMLIQDSSTIIQRLLTTIYTIESQPVARALVTSIVCTIRSLDQALAITPDVMEKIMAFWEEGKLNQIITALRMLKGCLRIFLGDPYKEHEEAQQFIAQGLSGSLDLLERCGSPECYQIQKILLGMIRLITYKSTVSLLVQCQDLLGTLHKGLLMTLQMDGSEVSVGNEVYFWKSKARATEIWLCYFSDSKDHEELQDLALQVGGDYTESFLSILAETRPSSDYDSLEVKAYDTCICDVLEALSSEVCRHPSLFPYLNQDGYMVSLLSEDVLLGFLKLDQNDDEMLTSDPFEYAYRSSDEVRTALSCPHGKACYDDCDQGCSDIRYYELLHTSTPRSSAMRLIREIMTQSGEEMLTNFLEYMKDQLVSVDLSAAVEKGGEDLPGVISARAACLRAIACCADAVIDFDGNHDALVIEATRQILEVDVKLTGNEYLPHLRAISLSVLGRISVLFLQREEVDHWVAVMNALLDGVTDEHMAVRMHGSVSFKDSIGLEKPDEDKSQRLLNELMPSLIDAVLEKAFEYIDSPQNGQLFEVLCSCLYRFQGKLGRSTEDEIEDEDAIVGQSIERHSALLDVFTGKIVDVVASIPDNSTSDQEEAISTYTSVIHALSSSCPYQNSEVFFSYNDKLQEYIQMTLSVPVYSIVCKQTCDAEVIDVFSNLSGDGRERSLEWISWMIDPLEQVEDGAESIVTMIMEQLVLGGSSLVLNNSMGFVPLDKFVQFFCSSLEKGVNIVPACDLMRTVLLMLISSPNDTDEITIITGAMRHFHDIQFDDGVLDTLHETINTVSITVLNTLEKYDVQSIMKVDSVTKEISRLLVVLSCCFIADCNQTNACLLHSHGEEVYSWLMSLWLPVTTVTHRLMDLRLIILASHALLSVAPRPTLPHLLLQAMHSSRMLQHWRTLEASPLEDDLPEDLDKCLQEAEVNLVVSQLLFWLRESPETFDGLLRLTSSCGLEAFLALTLPVVSQQPLPIQLRLYIYREQWLLALAQRNGSSQEQLQQHMTRIQELQYQLVLLIQAQQGQQGQLHEGQQSHGGNVMQQFDVGQFAVDGDDFAGMDPSMEPEDMMQQHQHMQQ